MIVEINLGILKFDLDECSIDKLDKVLEKQIKERQRKSFKEFLEKQDKMIASKKTCCPKCKIKMRNKGKLPVKISMISGKVSVKKTRFRCLACGAERYPLDEFWNTDKGHTFEMIEKALYLATEVSYEKASTTLNKLTGAKISHGKLQKIAKQEGAIARKELEDVSSDLFGLGLDPGEIIKRTKNDCLVIAIDGGFIPDREKDYFEAKVGVIYGLKANVSKNRVALTDRVAYASLEDSFKFGQKLFCLARRHGLMSAGKVIAIGDGARWIRNLIADFFPKAIYLLDLFHLKTKINKVLNTDEDMDLREAICEVCQRGQPDKALFLLDSYKALTPEKQEEVRKLKYYIRSNRVGIANYRRSSLFGSGAVEKAVDIIVSRRFKTRGMSWLRPGAAGMLALRLLRFNGQWDSYWKKRFDGLCAT